MVQYRSIKDAASRGVPMALLREESVSRMALRSRYAASRDVPTKLFWGEFVPHMVPRGNAAASWDVSI
jgi:hypothetical protein